MSSHQQWTLQLRRDMAVERFKKLNKQQRAWFSLLFGYADSFTVDEARSACVLLDKVLKGDIECQMELSLNG